MVVRADFISRRTVQAFLGWAKVHANTCFIFIAQTIESAAYQLSLSSAKVLFFHESEGERIGSLLARRIQGETVRSRRQERMAVQSQVMLKKSVMTKDSPTGAGVQFLREGHMKDFSQGGAQISLGQGGVRVRDFISLMYQNRHGQWVSVESQVRWVVSTSLGEQIIGVQFLAVSA
ncbi:PilZ domain-containing protein [Bdellovibrio sp. 22V]|uniref:PilZ domain-containing protein n=1 Tax=Bdellovibrio TaxID=958 RepID=UPI0025430CC5|nr:PilZ domain-containing protein [Bdellovibrio sp. 22V]WII71911.1 PilZ domain-containing protein [Bdellovibrio sp. 22V]